MSREQWFVSGLELTDSNRWDVEYRTGLYMAPAQSGDNPSLPGTTGELWRPKKHGPGRFVLNMWLGDPTSRATVEDNYDLMLRALMRPHELLQFTRILAGGDTRQCWGEVVSDLAPDPAFGQLGMRYSAEVHVPAGYWESNADSTNASTVGAALPQTLVLDQFADATAPMETLTYRVDGPITNPQVVDTTDTVDGFSFTYTGTIPSGQYLLIDSGNWAVTGGGGFAPNLAAFTYTDARFMTVVSAKPGFYPTVQLRGLSGGGNTALTVTGRRRYLC